jgi:hypothetical protein
MSRRPRQIEFVLPQVLHADAPAVYRIGYLAFRNVSRVPSWRRIEQLPRTLAGTAEKEDISCRT